MMFKSIYAKHFLIIFFVGLIILWPSFFLHFDGDSYLTLWRFQYNTQILDRPLISNLLTDYGPQDSLFALMHNIFGFNPFYYYLLSFLFRVLAAFTSYLLIKHITRSSVSALLAGVSFVSITAGSETTNWVFNMPSYLAIIVLNNLVLIYSKYTSFTFKKVISIIGLFALTMVIQPIRMAVLPIFMIIHSLIMYFSIKKIFLFKYAFVLVVVFIIMFGFGNIGDSVGITGSFQEKLSGKWLNTNNVNPNNISALIKNRKYEVLLYPIGQIGKVIVPDVLIEKKGSSLNKISYRLVILETLFFLIFLNRIFLRNLRKPITGHLINTSVLIWSILIISKFYFSSVYPLKFSELLSFAVGGQFLLVSLGAFINSKGFNKKKALLLSSIALMFLGFLLPWSRNPTTLFESTTRYFIVSSLAFSWSISLIYSLLSNNYLLKIGICILIVTNALSTYSYLADLKKNRDYESTENIRRSIPHISTLNTDETVLFYFQTNDNERLHNTLYFGFPVMMYYYQRVNDIWNIAYTTDFNEVVSSYLDGTGLSRFGTIKIKAVDLNNIYSFDLIDGKLIETSMSTRSKLKKLK